MEKPSTPFAPVAGPGVWYGRDLQPRTDWIRHFSAAELAELDAAVRAFKSSGQPLADISSSNFPLGAFGDTLRGLLRELLEGRGFFMLRGLPVERYSREEQAIAYMGIGAHLGRPFHFRPRQNPSGCYIFNTIAKSGHRLR